MQHRSEETRSRILDAAVRRFAIAGYDASSVDEICTAAGVSKGAFYHHFPTKQSIFLALLNGWLEMIDKSLNQLHKPTVPETLMHMVELLPAIFISAEDRLPMFLEFWLQASRDEAVWDATIAPYHHYQEHFMKLVKEGIEEGSFSQVDPQVAAQLIVSLAVGLLLQGVLEPKGADWEKVGKECMNILMYGMVKKD